MKNKKWLLSFVLAFCFLFPISFLTGCNKNETPKLKTNAITITVANKVYDGAAIEVSAEATNGTPTLSYKLKTAADTAYSATAPKDAGVYVVKVCVEADEEYAAATQTKEFTISPKELTVEWTDPANLVYSKEAKVATVAITDGVIAGEECEISAVLSTAENSNVNVGQFTYAVQLTNDNYTVANEDATKSYTITPKTITAEWTAPAGGLTYSGTAKVPTVAITDGVVAGDECGVSGALKAGDDNINAGTFEYVATLDNANYALADTDGQGKKSYTIEKANYSTIRQHFKRSDEQDWRTNNTTFTYGDTILMDIYTDGGEEIEGEVTYVLYEYNPEGSYSTVQATINGNAITPLGGGRIYIQAQVAVSRNYYADTSNGVQGFTIQKLAQNAQITSNISKTYDGTAVAAPTYTKLGDGVVTIEYKLQSAGEGAYDTTAPTNAGDYTVRVSVAEGTNYLAGSQTRDFTINKAAQNIQITSSPSKEYDGNSTNPLTYTYLGEGEVSVIREYKVQGADDNTYTQVAPFEVGTYTLRLRTEETANYLADSVTQDFTISMGTQDVQITSNISKTYDGNPVSEPSYTKKGDGAATVEYKVKDADDSTYTTTAPSAVGNYTVRVTIAEDPNKYLTGSATADFTIRDNSGLMSVSLNPSLEFVIDDSGKVASVSATNEEGNFVKASVNFVGMTPTDAIKAFLDFAKEQGYVVENASPEAITLTYKGVANVETIKTAVEAYLGEIDIAATVSTEEIVKNTLVEMAQTYLQEYSVAEIQAMTDKEILNLIAESREETDAFETQEIKDFYYIARSQALIIAKFECIYNIIKNEPSYATQAENLHTAIEAIETAFETFKQTYITLFLKATSPVNVAKSTWIDMKQMLLEAKKNGVEDLSELEASVAELEEAFTQAKTTQNEVISTLISSLETLSDALDDAIASIQNDLQTSNN